MFSYNGSVIDLDNLFTKIELELQKEEKIKTNLENLHKSPMYEYCPNNNNKFSVLPSILSSMYSTVLLKESLIKIVTDLYKQSSINAEIITVGALSTLKNNTKIEFVNDLQEYYSDAFEPALGAYAHKENRITVKVQENLPSTVIHEFTHYAMHILFNNHMSPYKNTDQKEQFTKAVKHTLFNIQNYLKTEYALDLFSSKQESTHELSHSIMNVIATKTGYIFQSDAWNYSSIVSDLKKYNLLDSLLVEDTFSLLSLAMHFSNNELTKKLILSGINTENKSISVILAQNNNVEMFYWLMDKNINVNANELTCFGTNALDYASSPEMIEALIKAGATAYPSNSQEICPLLPRCSYVQTKHLDLEAIFQLLKYNIEYYDQESEHSEIIAYFVDIISSEGYKNTPIKNITKPLFDYWETVITPSVQDYLQLEGITNYDMSQFDYSAY